MPKSYNVSHSNRIYNVYIDETGQNPYFNEKEQCVLTLAGVGTEIDETTFDSHTWQLLQEFGLSHDAEIHINEIFSRNPKPPFDKLNSNTQQDFVYSFLKLGMEYVDFVHAPSHIKPFIKPQRRIELEDQNLDLYLYAVYRFAIELDFCFLKFNKGKYRLIFDDHSDFHKRTKKMIEELCKDSDSYYSLKRFLGPPEKRNSKNSRFIQLADTVCYIYTRYRQFEVKTLKKSPNLRKHESFYNECYLLIKDKILPFVSTYLEGISGESQSILDFKEFDTRNFNHMGNWLTRKRKPQKPGTVLDFLTFFSFCDLM